jgi:integrase
MADERARSGGTFRARSRDTIGAWVKQWLEHEKKPSLASSTFAVYEVAWRVHAKPLIETRRLDNFSSDDVARVYAELRNKSIGGRTVQVVAKVVRAAFDAAIRREKYPHAMNPWRIVPIPRHTYKEARVLTAAETQRFLTAARGDRFEALWALALFGGLRLGECLGLKWEDVDLDSGELRARQQATEVYGRVAVGPLKTKSSRRNLVVTGIALEALGRRKAAADSEGHRSPFVFTAPNGALLDRNNVRRRHFAEVCKQAKITGLRPHDLRHTMTSHAIAAGLSPIAVAQRLGHGSTRMTLDRYGHAMPGQQKEARPS